MPEFSEELEEFLKNRPKTFTNPITINISGPGGTTVSHDVERLKRILIREGYAVQEHQKSLSFTREEYIDWVNGLRHTNLTDDQIFDRDEASLQSNGELPPVIINASHCPWGG